MKVIMLLVLFWIVKGTHQQRPPGQRPPGQGQCNPRDVRIVGSNNRLEVCDNGSRWRVICDEFFGENEAQAACRQMNMTSAIYLPGQVVTVPRIPRRYSCSRTALSLSECSTTNNELCPLEAAVRLICTNDYLNLLELNLNDVQGSISRSLRLESGQHTRVNLSQPIRLGNMDYNTAFVYANGLISFGKEHLPNGELRDLDLEEGTIYPILSPFFADINGQLDIEIRLLQRSVRANVNIFSLDKFISAGDTSFETELMFLVQWREVISSNSSILFQSVLATDYTDTYAIYTYQCNGVLRPISALIGYHIDDDLYAEYRYSNTPYSFSVACVNEQFQESSSVSVSNLVYPVNSNETRDVSDRNTCGSINSCCMPFRDATISCRPSGSSCYCDSLCLARGDCCDDFRQIEGRSLTPCIPLCEPDTVNQIGGTAYTSGPLSVCIDGLPRFYDFTLEDQTAVQSVVCQQLSRQSNDMTDRGQFGQELVRAGTIQCVGTEAQVQDCDEESDLRIIGGINRLPAIDCGVDNEMCINGDARLNDPEGSSTSSGTLEICVAGVWVPVCSTGTDVDDFTIVCRILGFTNATRDDVTLDTITANGNTMGIQQVECPRTATTIRDCDPLQILASCPANELRVISCAQETLPTTSNGGLSEALAGIIAGSVVGFLLASALIIMIILILGRFLYMTLNRNGSHAV